LDHEGIQYDCLIYNSADMGALRAELGATLKVDIWVSDEDLGYIYVEVPQRDISIRVLCLDQHYASGLTRWQHEKCKAMQRVCKDEGLQLTLDDARERISELIYADLKEFRHARRKTRTRFTERAKKHPSEETATSSTTMPEESVEGLCAADQAVMRTEEQVAPALDQTSLQRR
jgi:putative transposase